MNDNPFSWANPFAEDDAYDAKMQKQLDDEPRIQAPTPPVKMTLLERIRWGWHRYILLSLIRKTSHDINHYEETRLTCGRRIEFLLRQQQKLKAELFYHEHPQPRINRVRF